MSDVKLVLFNNGLQIVGEFTEVDSTIGKVTIKKPVQLVFAPRSEQEAQNGKMGMAFTPFMQYSVEWTTGVVFSANDILSVLTPITELMNNYSTNFGSGLVLPGAGNSLGGLILP